MELVKYDAMRLAIAKAHDVDEVKDIRDKAEALRVYSKQSKQGVEDINRVTEIKLRAERRAGQLLRELPTQQGERNDITSPHAGEKLEVQTKTEIIKDVGIGKGTADRWQQMADLPETEFEAHIQDVKDNGQELTTSSVLRKQQQHKRAVSNQMRADNPPAPVQGKYRVFYADPPWYYGNSGVINESDNYGRANRHYPSMTIAELCAMGSDVMDASEKNAVLFMWVTSPLLEECFPVIRAWGFKYKSSFIWDKVAHNFAHYNSMRHELLLVCTRGSCLPDHDKLLDSVISIEKSRKHSEKPKEFRELVDLLYPHGSRIELFAREAVPNWDSWGNEANV